VSQAATDYFIGVNPLEIERLRDQHTAWLPETQALWRQAGFASGQHIADLGSGPGINTFDLARIVGAAGRVAAVDKAPRYLDFVRAESARRGVHNVYTLETDLAAENVIPGDFWRFSSITWTRHSLASTAVSSPVACSRSWST